MNDAYVYAGPYILTESAIGKITTKIPKCPDTSCQTDNEPRQGKFCSRCGKEVILIESEKEGAVVSAEAVRKLMDPKNDGADSALHSRYIARNNDRTREIVAWTPSDPKRKPDRSPTWNSKYSAFLEPVNATLIAQEIRWLEETYSQELAILHQQYGNFKVAWGVMGEVV